MKEEKIETLSKLIDIKKELEESKVETNKLKKRMDVVEKTVLDNHRTVQNQIKRSIWEYTQIALGHKKEVEKLSHRVGDNEARFTRIEEIITWTLRGIIGLFVATIVAAVLKIVFHID